ncbi:hypothetical protein MishRS11D_00560 [Methylomagnum ishizawai]|nr:hypothetical protein MishRS11D_00560 [Methylomagnum ishizawai]
MTNIEDIELIIYERQASGIEILDFTEDERLGAMAEFEVFILIEDIKLYITSIRAVRR